MALSTIKQETPDQTPTTPPPELVSEPDPKPTLSTPPESAPALKVDTTPAPSTRVTLNLPATAHPSSAADAARAAALVLAAVQRLNAVASIRNAAARTAIVRRPDACACEVPQVPGLRVDVVVNIGAANKRGREEQLLSATKKRRVV